MIQNELLGTMVQFEVREDWKVRLSYNYFNVPCLSFVNPVQYTIAFARSFIVVTPWWAECSTLKTSVFKMDE